MHVFACLNVVFGTHTSVHTDNSGQTSRSALYARILWRMSPVCLASACWVMRDNWADRETERSQDLVFCSWFVLWAEAAATLQNNASNALLGFMHFDVPAALQILVRQISLGIILETLQTFEMLADAWIVRALPVLGRFILMIEEHICYENTIL